MINSMWTGDIPTRQDGCTDECTNAVGGEHATSCDAFASTLDSRVQTDNPDEPLFEDGAFHVELIALDPVQWGVYDAYMNKVRLIFATITEAIDATIELSEASNESQDALDEAYGRLVVEARASLGQSN